MRKTLFIVMLLLAAMSLSAQQKGRVTGVVRDAETGETLIGVAVIEPKLKTGTATDARGAYSLELPVGTMF